MEEQEEDAEEREETGVAGASALLCSASARAVSSIHTHTHTDKFVGTVSVVVVVVHRGGEWDTRAHVPDDGVSSCCDTHTQACIRSGLDRQRTCGSILPRTLLGKNHPREKCAGRGVRECATSRPQMTAQEGRVDGYGWICAYADVIDAVGIAAHHMRRAHASHLDGRHG